MQALRQPRQRARPPRSPTEGGSCEKNDACVRRTGAVATLGAQRRGRDKRRRPERGDVPSIRPAVIASGPQKRVSKADGLGRTPARALASGSRQQAAARLTARQPREGLRGTPHRGERRQTRKYRSTSAPPRVQNSERRGWESLLPHRGE